VFKEEFRVQKNPLSIECPFSSKRRSMRVTEKKEKSEKVREG